MKIEYIRARNFLSIGEEPVEIDFTQFGKLVLINGKNLDFTEPVDGTEVDLFHSNAAGKSTISEILVYGLYGDTVRKRVTHTDAIHNQSKKGLEVEVVFSIDDKRYRVVRTRKPDTLKLWQDGPPWQKANEITRGGQPATQTQIEEIVKMNHKAFVNVVYFGQHNDYNFLECSPAEQRQIAENLLSLESFKNYCEQAKEEVKENKVERKQISALYEQILSSETSAAQRIQQIENKKADWQASLTRELAGLEKQLLDIEKKLSNTDLGPVLLQYEKAQQEIIEIRELLPKRREQESQLETALEQAKTAYDRVHEKIHELMLGRKSAQQDLLDHKKQLQKEESEIAKLEQLPTGSRCPHCYGPIDKQHYKHVIQLHNNKIEALAPKISLAETKLEQLDLEMAKQQQALSKLEHLKQLAQSKLKSVQNDITNNESKVLQLSKVQKPNLSLDEMVLRERLVQTKESIANKRKELDSEGPYVEILETAKIDLLEIQDKKAKQKTKLDDLDGELPYYEWWVNGFDDIKSFIIERITPSLNSRIALWLDYLLHGKLRVTFDKHLNATIESPNGNAYAYFAMCGSEKRRINLAISQAFAYVMMLSSGTWPSLVFLDEVSDSICQKGVQDVYKMICELSNEKQVFVITHNVLLRQMLEGVDNITMVRQDGSTTLA